ncbi:hypothetical protein IW262DRAFT_1301067 [Armillaria fumosa]|nr:hypothetical protein IW262DRAFT_1301067 [Armillaria fumosa]
MDQEAKYLPSRVALVTARTVLRGVIARIHSLLENRVNTDSMNKESIDDDDDITRFNMTTPPNFHRRRKVHLDSREPRGGLYTRFVLPENPLSPPFFGWGQMKRIRRGWQSKRSCKRLTQQQGAGPGRSQNSAEELTVAVSLVTILKPHVVFLTKKFQLQDTFVVKEEHSTCTLNQHGKGRGGGRCTGFKTQNHYIRRKFFSVSPPTSAFHHTSLHGVDVEFLGRPNTRLTFPCFQGHLERGPLHPHNLGNGQYRSKQREAHKNTFS